MGGWVAPRSTRPTGRQSFAIMDSTTTDGQRASKALTAGPYGDAAALVENSSRFDAGFERLLQTIAQCSFESPARHCLAGHIYFSGCLGEALKLVTAGQSDELGRFALQVRDELEQATAVKSVPVGGWAVLQPHDDILTNTIVERAWRSISEDDGSHPELNLLTPSSHELNALEQSRDVLIRVLPELATGTLSTVRGVAVLGGNVESAFFWTTPGLVFINRTRLVDPLLAADSLFHECTHQKMLFIRLVRRILRPGYDDWSGLTIPIPWGAQQFRTFTTGRAIAAAHVYLHLTAFHLRLLELWDDLALEGRADVEIRLGQRAARSTYLLEALASPYYRGELGADGEEFLQWMLAINTQMLHASAGSRRVGELASLLTDG